MEKVLIPNEGKLFEPLIIRPLKEIQEELIPELHLCIDTFNNAMSELKEYFTKNMEINPVKHMFIVNPKEDCLVKMAGEINKRGLDPMIEWFGFFQSQPMNNILVAKVEQHNGLYLSNYVCILNKQLKDHVVPNNGKICYKIKSVLLDTHYGTGFEKELCDFIKKRFNGPQFKEMNLKNIVVDRVVCTYYYNHNAEENDKYLYVSYQLPFCDYNDGKGRYIYYLTMNGDFQLVNECVLCSRFGQINYIL